MPPRCASRLQTSDTQPRAGHSTTLTLSQSQRNSSHRETEREPSACPSPLSVTELSRLSCLSPKPDSCRLSVWISSRNWPRWRRTLRQRTRRVQPRQPPSGMPIRTPISSREDPSAREPPPVPPPPSPPSPPMSWQRSETGRPLPPTETPPSAQRLCSPTRFLVRPRPCFSDGVEGASSPPSLPDRKYRSDASTLCRTTSPSGNPWGSPTRPISPGQPPSSRTSPRSLLEVSPVHPPACPLTSSLWEVETSSSRRRLP
mmetsp:Transcript_55309/g.108228  ORF Transcript_55309/g.108228 Transcript_55309/m.108228 type:complete len:258 (-) Transcript_55309:2696-3469(-)